MARKIMVDGQEIIERRKNNNGYKYTWAAISFFALVTLTTMGWLITTKAQSENRVTKIEQDYTEIKKDISSIKTDIGWIKDTLQDKYKKRGGEEK